LSWLDTLWNLPALPALIIWGAPVEGAILWLIYRVRTTVRKTSALGDMMPELNEEEKEALAWTIKRAIANEVLLYRKTKGRGEA
jgi:hypothetical protein